MHMICLDAAGVSMPICTVLLLFPFCSLLLPVASLSSCRLFSLACPTKKRNKTCSNMKPPHDGTISTMCYICCSWTIVRTVESRDRQHHKAMENVVTTIAPIISSKQSYIATAAGCTCCATSSGADTSNIGQPSKA